MLRCLVDLRNKRAVLRLDRVAVVRLDGALEKRTAFSFVEIGSLNAVSLLVGFGIGWLVDTRLGTTPIFIFVGLFAGIGCGAYATYRRMRRYL